MRNKKPLKIFSEIKVIDAGAKGKSVGKAPDGRIIFMKEAIPGDIVDVPVSYTHLTLPTILLV